MPVPPSFAPLPASEVPPDPTAAAARARDDLRQFVLASLLDLPREARLQTIATLTGVPLSIIAGGIGAALMAPSWQARATVFMLLPRTLRTVLEQATEPRFASEELAFDHRPVLEELLEPDDAMAAALTALPEATRCRFATSPVRLSVLLDGSSGGALRLAILTHLLPLVPSGQPGQEETRPAPLAHLPASAFSPRSARVQRWLDRLLRRDVPPMRQSGPAARRP